ncbi:DUF7858 family protein [Halocalculus aciditolerans]|uniref:Uncharacterized protein n=1 Tax=Halocalculus aciditolerans TaxID=1383812 RepID=A0A830FEV0_9EURY|nr:hypothetical protein [Halocalculus aciditolerans]GGL48223.1 hypothetical protein GCM10009039_03070 [Halocalculus aciditolerans]
MGLADLAAGLEVTARQEDRGVATVDARDTPLAERLAPYAEDLPCSLDAAAALLDGYGGGTSVGGAASAAGVPPTTAAKTLHLLGVEGITPLSPLAREVVRDWLDGRLSRTDAVELAGCEEAEFALGVYVETHDPLPGARAVANGVALGGDAAVAKRDALADTLPTDLG